MRFKLLLIIIFIVQSLALSGQTDWMKVYFPDKDALGNSVANSYDHGILLVGKHGSNYTNFNWLIKTDVNGDKLWEKTIGDYSSTIKVSTLGYNNYGELYLAGLTSYNNNYNYDPMLIKLNPCGEKDWCKVFYAEDNNFIIALEVTSDGGCVVLLRYMNPDITKDRLSLAGLSVDGELKWFVSYNSSDTNLFNEDA
jgi:hypothetical protein